MKHLTLVVAYLFVVTPVFGGETIDFANGEEDLLIYGDQMEGGRTTFTSDLNGDGKEDLIFSSRRGDGADDLKPDAGEIHIVFGAESYAGAVDMAGTDGALPDVTIYGATAGDLLFTGQGNRADGDVNGDGIPDLVVGVHLGDGPGDTRTDAGEVYVFFGKTTWPSSIDLAVTAPDVIIYDATIPFGRMGTRIAVGDLNDDGLDDMVFGAPGVPSLFAGPGINYGAIGIVYGSATLPAVIDVDDTPLDVLILGASSEDSLGSLINIADIDQDGIRDLVFATNVGDGPGDTRSNAGEVYIVYGSNALPATIDLASDEQDVIIYGASADDGLRMDNSYNPLGIGDFNADGYPDLLLKAFAADGPGEARPDAGEMYVIAGSASLPAVIDLASGGASTIIYGATAGDTLGDGVVLGAGDFNGDGAADIFAGSYLGDGPGETRPDSGEAYLIFGGASLPAVVDLGAGGADMVIHGAGSGEQLSALELMDLNGDGLEDLFLAAAGNGPANDRALAGEGYVVFGTSTPPAVLDLAIDMPDLIYYCATAGDILEPSSWNAGDVNGDGVPDFLFGLGGADGPGEARPDVGELYLNYGEGTGEMAAVTAVDAPGDVLPRDFGSTRTTIDFDAGTGTSETTVTLVRSNDDLSNLGLGVQTGEVYWQIDSDRVDFGTAQVQFQYLDSEIAGLDESQLVLYHAPSPDGPWTVVEDQMLDPTTNTITANLDSFSVFTIGYEVAVQVPVSQTIPYLTALLIAAYSIGVLASLQRRRR